MLKIKDNVDLKELEKYGFFKEELNYFDIFTGEKKHREIYENNNFDSIYPENRRMFIGDNELLYDLIKDGLVEKVE